MLLSKYLQWQWHGNVSTKEGNEVENWLAWKLIICTYYWGVSKPSAHQQSTPAKLTPIIFLFVKVWSCPPPTSVSASTNQMLNTEQYLSLNLCLLVLFACLSRFCYCRKLIVGLDYEYLFEWSSQRALGGTFERKHNREKKKIWVMSWYGTMQDVCTYKGMPLDHLMLWASDSGFHDEPRRQKPRVLLVTILGTWKCREWAPIISHSPIPSCELLLNPLSRVTLCNTDDTDTVIMLHAAHNTSDGAWWSYTLKS